jgi:hypothetical protein
LVVGLLLPASIEGQTPAAAVPPVTVTTTVEPQRVTIGTPFRYTMRVESTGEAEIVVPVLADRLGEFAILDFGEVPHEKTAARAIVERWYTMVTYESGDKIVPGPPVQYRIAGGALERLTSPDALLIVESLLPKNADALGKATPRDIKGPVAVALDYGPLWWLGGGLAVAVALVVALYRFLNGRRQIVVPPPRPAHEVAFEALTRLRAARLLESASFEQYYVQLSAIVRTYLESRLELRAPEMTSEEFLLAAQRDHRLPNEHRSALTQFLSEADLVKFARYVPAPDDAERAYRAARQFVEATAPVEVNRAAA